MGRRNGCVAPPTISPARVVRLLLPAALPAVVALSTVLHWIAGRRLHGLWIVPDEAIYAMRAVAVWHHGPLTLLHGPGAGYGLLYPLVAGLPLSTGSTATGYASLKLLQALVVSLAAVPVFFYGRRVMPSAYALLAATLTVASPLLLYSGLVMTEVLFYPVAALALLAVARAVATTRPRDQGIALVLIAAAVLTRTQAVAFVAIFAAAIVVDAALARDRSRLRAFWPTWLVLAVAAIATAAVPGVVGAYSGTLRGSYPLRAALRLTYEHLSYVALSTGLVPFAALVLLLLGAIRGRERDPEARALLAVIACSIVVIVVQVGFFAARYSPHLLGRDLAALPPLLFIALALWLARGAPRTRITATLVAFGVLCLVLLAPWSHLAQPVAFADTFGVMIFWRLHTEAPVDAVMVFSIAMLAAFVFVPRRAALALPALVLAALVPASVIASNQLAGAVNSRQTDFVGPTPNWIDRAAGGGVAYVYGGEANWSVVWQERFWNRRIDRVLTVGPALVPGPMPQTAVTAPPDGRLPMRERYIVAADRFSFVGSPVAHLAQTGLDVSGLTLWRLDDAPRVSTIEHNVQPNGDMTYPATVTVYDCRPGGRLELTLLPKATSTLRVLLNGQVALDEPMTGDAWNATVVVPPSHHSGICTFTIVPQSLLGSTKIAFVRR